jgi:hypothetical protein
VAYIHYADNPILKIHTMCNVRIHNAREDAAINCTLPCAASTAMLSLSFQFKIFEFSAACK